MEISDIEADKLDELYKLFKAECDRDKTEPSPKEFHNWLVENLYVSD